MGGFDQAARNECMCIFHAKHGAQAEVPGRANSKMQRYIRSDRSVVTFDLRSLYLSNGRSLPKLWK